MPKNTTEKKHFLLVVNKYGSGYLFTDESTFKPENDGTFEEWRAEAAKAYEPSTTENGWEEEFDETFNAEQTPDGSTYWKGGNTKAPSPRKIKTFIQQIAKEAYERGREEVVEFLRGKAELTDKGMAISAVHLLAALEAPNEETL